MNDGIARFERFWSDMDLSLRCRYVHPADEPLVDAGLPGEAQLQLHVLPIPVNGNLRSADVVILMLNPNFDDSSNEEWKAAHPIEYARMEACQRANIRQQHSHEDHPFYDIDPLFQGHPGAGYWRGGGKLAGIAAELANRRCASLEQAYEEISRRVAVLQLVPYRSKVFGHHTLIDNAPSSAEAIALAQYLAAETDKLLIVQRQVRTWRFQFPSTRNNVIVYDPRTEARKASLALGSRGGPPILERLFKNEPSSVFRPPSPRASSGENPPRAKVHHASAEGSSHLLAPTESSERSNQTEREHKFMDRTEELMQIFELSGLKDVLVTKGRRYFPEEGFSTLMFEGNDFRVSSIELYDPKREDSYFRIHYLDGAPGWLVETLALWPGFRNANSTGANFLGDPSVHAKALAGLLASRQ